MFFEIDKNTTKRASMPHELSLLNLSVFHLLAAPASVALKIGMLGFLVPLALSLSFITFAWLRTQRANTHEPWYIAIHWRLAAYRTKVLLIGYLITAAILGFAFFAAEESSKGDIMMIALSRVAVVPVVLAVFVSFVMETSAVAQARRGEVPDSLVKKYPPPADLKIDE